MNFKDYLDISWKRWKYTNLNEVNETAKEAIAAEFPGSQSTSRLPILFDKKDWEYLTQFPPHLWAQALTWRYRTGLLMASQWREMYVKYKGNLKELKKYYLSRGDYNETQVNNLLKGCKDGEFNPNCILPDYIASLTLTGSKNKYIFNNVYVGYKYLFDKLEKPIKPHEEYKISIGDNPYFSKEKGQVYQDVPGASINQIDVKAATPEEVKDGLKHKSEYQGGFYDFDLGQPVKMTKADIMSLPEDDPWIQNLIDGDKITNAKEAREVLSKNPPIHFAGMPALTATAASNNLQVWFKTQGIGLLGRPKNNKIKIGDKEYDVKYMTVEEIKQIDPDFYKQIPQTLGEGGKKGGAIPLRYPVIQKQLFYRQQKRGQEGFKIVNETKIIPVLMPGKIFPLLQGDVLDEFKKKLAERRGRISDRANKEQIGDINQLLMNIDLLLTQDEIRQIQQQPSRLYDIILNNIYIKEFLSGQKTIHELLAKKMMGIKEFNRVHGTTEESPVNDDEEELSDDAELNFRGSVGRGEDYYSVGFNFGKQQRHRWPLNMTKEQLKNAINDYLLPNKNSKIVLGSDNYKTEGNKMWMKQTGDNCSPYGLVGEACRGIKYFISQLRKKIQESKGNISGGQSFSKIGEIANAEMVLEMMSDESVFESLVNVGAALMLLNLNHPFAGIYDPDAGLYVVNPQRRSETAQKANQNWRMGWAYRFAHDLAQAALTPASLTRRERQKGLLKQTATGEVEGTVDLNNIARSSEKAQNNAFKNRTRIWYSTRNRKDNEQINVSRPGWLVPLYNESLNNYLRTLSHEIIDKLGENNFTQNIIKDIANIKDVFIAVNNTRIDLYLDAYDQYVEQYGREPDEQNENKTLKDYVERNLAATLKARHPEVFGNISDDDLGRIVSGAAQETPDIIPTARASRVQTNVAFDYRGIINTLTQNLGQQATKDFVELQQTNSNGLEELLRKRSGTEEFLILNGLLINDLQKVSEQGLSFEDLVADVVPIEIPESLKNIDNESDLIENLFEFKDINYNDIQKNINELSGRYGDINKYNAFLGIFLKITKEDANRFIVKLIQLVDKVSLNEALKTAIRLGYNPPERNDRTLQELPEKPIPVSTGITTIKEFEQYMNDVANNRTSDSPQEIISKIQGSIYKLRNNLSISIIRRIIGNFYASPNVNQAIKGQILSILLNTASLGLPDEAEGDVLDDNGI